MSGSKLKVPDFSQLYSEGKAAGFCLLWCLTLEPVPGLAVTNGEKEKTGKWGKPAQLFSYLNVVHFQS